MTYSSMEKDVKSEAISDRILVSIEQNELRIAFDTEDGYQSIQSELLV